MISTNGFIVIIFIVLLDLKLGLISTCDQRIRENISSLGYTNPERYELQQGPIRGIKQHDSSTEALKENQNMKLLRLLLKKLHLQLDSTQPATYIPEIGFSTKVTDKKRDVQGGLGQVTENILIPTEIAPEFYMEPEETAEESTIAEEPIDSQLSQYFTNFPLNKNNTVLSSSIHSSQVMTLQQIRPANRNSSLREFDEELQRLTTQALPAQSSTNFLQLQNIDQALLHSSVIGIINRSILTQLLNATELKDKVVAEKGNEDKALKDDILEKTEPTTKKMFDVRDIQMDRKIKEAIRKKIFEDLLQSDIGHTPTKRSMTLSTTSTHKDKGTTYISKYGQANNEVYAQINFNDKVVQRKLINFLKQLSIQKSSKFGESGKDFNFETKATPKLEIDLSTEDLTGDKKLRTADKAVTVFLITRLDRAIKSTKTPAHSQEKELNYSLKVSETTVRDKAEKSKPVFLNDNSSSSKSLTRSSEINEEQKLNLKPANDSLGYTELIQFSVPQNTLYAAAFACSILLVIGLSVGISYCCIVKSPKFVQLGGFRLSARQGKEALHLRSPSYCFKAKYDKNTIEARKKEERRKKQEDREQTIELIDKMSPSDCRDVLMTTLQRAPLKRLDRNPKFLYQASANSMLTGNRRVDERFNLSSLSETSASEIRKEDEKSIIEN